MTDWTESLVLAETVEPGDDRIHVKLVATLGVEPDHETIYITGLDDSVRPWQVLRGQAGTSARSWPALTALTYRPLGSRSDADPMCLTLRQPISADAVRIEANDHYVRAKIGSEIVHVVHESGRIGERLDVERGKEGTAEAAHPAGATLTWLGPGEA